MQLRSLEGTSLRVSALGFGGSALGEEYGPIDLDEAMRAVRAALDAGINLIDTAPYYGRGLSELLIGRALQGVRRDRYLLSTKVGRYDVGHFDFSRRRVLESIDVSLRRLRVDHVDLALCHDVEFADLTQIVEETLPALRDLQRDGKVRFVGVSAYPLATFRALLARTRLDVILSYSHYTLQNDTLATLAPLAASRGVGILNASPFSGGLLTGEPPPAWHKAEPEVRAACRRAAEICRTRGVPLAQLALQVSLRNPAFASCIAGTPLAEHVRQWARWAEQPIDEALLAEVAAALRPVHNRTYVEGRRENNDARVSA